MIANIKAERVNAIGINALSVPREFPIINSILKLALQFNNDGDKKTHMCQTTLK